MFCFREKMRGKQNSQQYPNPNQYHWNLNLNKRLKKLKTLFVYISFCRQPSNRKCTTWAALTSHLIILRWLINRTIIYLYFYFWRGCSTQLKEIDVAFACSVYLKRANCTQFRSNYNFSQLSILSTEVEEKKHRNVLSFHSFVNQQATSVFGNWWRQVPGMHGKVPF